MAEGFVHTVRVDAHWENTLEGQDGMLGGPYETKSEAVAAGRAEATPKDRTRDPQRRRGNQRAQLVWRRLGPSPRLTH